MKTESRFRVVTKKVIVVPPGERAYEHPARIAWEEGDDSFVVVPLGEDSALYGYAFKVSRIDLEDSKRGVPCDRLGFA